MTAAGVWNRTLQRGMLKWKNPVRMGTPKKIGRYDILEELGHGAMGTVYRAKDPAMDRVVAVKTIISLALASEKGSDFRERFYREARAAGALAHPGIVPVFDVGEHEGVPFLVMEFISGKTLADTIRSGERMTLDRVCEMGQKIAEALGYAHQRGVVHRDIKPANILLTSKQAHGIERPKITDFGVAKLAAGNTTMTGQVLGTPAFMPPEQITGAPVDGRADLFSLGVVLYWLATGEQPFPGESITAVSYKVVHTEPIPPRKLNPSIPFKLESTILKCLAKSPEDRYQTGEDLARDLGELRAVSTSMGLNNPAPETIFPGSDPNATLIETPSAAQPGRTTAAPIAPAPAPKTHSNNVLILAGLAIVILVAGGWYGLQRKAAPHSASTESPLVTVPAPATDKNAATETPAPALPEVAPPPPTASAGANSATNLPKKPEAKVAPEKPTPPKVAPSASKPEAAAAGPAPLDFNPKALDPKANARLKIDALRMPPAVDFTVELNGKLFLRRSAEGNKSEFDDFFVPPGVQEFRVTAASGAVRKISNAVSLEFAPKKRHTLKIELRTQGAAAGTGVPQGLYPDTQIVLTLK
jgi:eukaryotic-like serine/threonine-protein kinase